MCLTIPAKVVPVKEGPSGSPIRKIIVEDFKGGKEVNASVAQLDRAMVFETIGRRFESCQTHQIQRRRP